MKNMNLIRAWAVALMASIMMMPFAHADTNAQEDATLNSDTAVVSAGSETNVTVTPDHPLWGVKIAIEKVQLALTFNNTKRAEIALQQANKRLLEVEAMFTKRDYYPEMENFDAMAAAGFDETDSESTTQAEKKPQREVIRFTHFKLIDKLVVLEIIDELEMILNRRPTIKDVVYMSKTYGMHGAIRIINELAEEEFLEIEGLKVGRVQR